MERAAGAAARHAACLGIAGALLPRAAAACATCYGAADAPMVGGMNNAIFLLLGFVGLLWLGVGKLFWDFSRRSRRLARPAPRLRLLKGGKA